MRKKDIRNFFGEMLIRPKKKWDRVTWLIEWSLWSLWTWLISAAALFKDAFGLLLIAGLIGLGTLVFIYFGIAKGK